MVTIISINLQVDSSDKGKPIHSTLEFKSLNLHFQSGASKQLELSTGFRKHFCVRPDDGKYRFYAVWAKLALAITHLCCGSIKAT